MKKIALCILHPQYVISWFDTEIINELALENNVHIFGPDEIIEFAQIKSNYNKNIELHRIKVSKSSVVSRSYFFFSMVNKISMNSSFKARFRNLIFGELKLVPRPFLSQNLIKCLNSNMKHLFNYIKNYYYQIPAFIPILNTLLLKILKTIYSNNHLPLPTQMDRHFDLMIFLGGANELEIFELIKAAKQNGNKTLLCLENWDNLTSKRFMITKPDFTFVMGQDSARLASLVQDLPRDKVVAAGLPRFNPYRGLKIFPNSNPKNQFEILYLGCYQPHNEIKLINTMVELLEKSLIKGQFKIKYKPHPGPRNRYVDSSKLSEIVEVVKSNLEVDRTNPVIDEFHISLIKNANIIISSPTSMILECMLMGKKTILDLTDDGFHRTTARKQFKDLIHFHVLNKLQNLEKAFEIDEIFQLILKEFFNPTIEPLKYDLDEIIEYKESSYSKHILKLMTQAN